ncbi:uncharacterized protein LOC143362063 isoform X1 [Halictus rubicundus]|uniref:uncharacterized protein LOC143362063 isoform X1 n=1 Tax=Halictus rubicundus TaxID=77578 RepID=UPI004037069A
MRSPSNHNYDRQKSAVEMDAGAGSPSPPNGDAYRKRRDSYSAAMINEPSENGGAAETTMKSQQLIVQRKQPRLPDNSSLESVSWSTGSSTLKRDLARTSSTDTSRSWNESIGIPEMFVSQPELLTRLAKCRCFLMAKLSISSECQCQCQCRCSQCQYHRRKISTCSSRDHATFLGGFKRKDSGYSVSTCQSILPASSGRNSVASLFHEIKEDAHESIVGVIQRRHSDQTQSPRGSKIGRADNRRFSEQTLVVGEARVGERARRSSAVAYASATKPIIARTSPRFFPEKVTGSRASQSSWTPLHNESHETDPAKEAPMDRRFAAQHRKERRDADGLNERRRSSATVTPKMMRRRFSEQLILEGGLGSVHDYEDLLREPEEGEESLTVINARKRITLKRHYYPEGGWGHVVVTVAVLVQVICHGLQLGHGVLLTHSTEKFHKDVQHAGWLGAMSTGVALLVSPITIAICRRKSTRLTAVLGGLVTALGCLFTSFATQFHQLFFSYGTVVGIGVGLTRDCSTLMVAQYFKRRRELVEIFVVSGSGLGIAVMSAFIKGAISKIGWRLGLQAVTGVVFLTFILGTFYRSASLYHPQRRAILHLKNQKRKIKDKNKTDDRPPFFDFSTLKSKTVRILLMSTGISAFGINTPIFYLAHQVEEEGLGDTVVLLQAYLGLAWTLGCVAFGLLVVHRSVECRIARQYLTQAAVFVCGVCILALTAVQGNYHGYVMFAWIYGIFCGGYHYSLKMYTYERVRARNFARTWGFVQCSQAIPIAIGVPISGYMNVGYGGKAGYYFSSTCVLVGSFTLFFIDLHRKNLSRHKHTRSNGTKHLCISDSCPQRRRLSFSQEPDNDSPHVAAAGAAAAALVLGAEISPTPGEMIDALPPEKPELTCISEEGIADMDLPDNMLEDLDYIGDCITSCNKVENYLMLSEFENNLMAEIITDRRGRRWSLARSKGDQSTERPGGLQSSNEESNLKPKWHGANVPPNNRMITVIDEASA